MKTMFVFQATFLKMYLKLWTVMMQHKTIDSVLARGERLDSLVEKSSDLSMASQVVSCQKLFMSINKTSLFDVPFLFFSALRSF